MRTMTVRIDYWEIEKRYRAKGDNTDEEFCINCGINPKSYHSRKYSKNRGMSLIVALLIAEYLDCNVSEFAFICWHQKKVSFDTIETVDNNKNI